MGFLRCCVYYAFLGVASFVLGRLLPKSWFRGDSFPYRCSTARCACMTGKARFPI